MELLLKEEGAAANWNTNKTCLFVLIMQCHPAYLDPAKLSLDPVKLSCDYIWTFKVMFESVIAVAFQNAFYLKIKIKIFIFFISAH